MLKLGLLVAVLSTVVAIASLTPTENSDNLLPLELCLLGIAIALALGVVWERMRQKSVVGDTTVRQIQESETRLQLALKAAQMGIWNLNLITKETDCTQETEQLFGMAPGTFDGRHETFLRFVHPDDRDALEQAVKTAIQQHSTYYQEYRIIWADGSIHWIEGNGQAFYDINNQPVRMTGTVRDISDRKSIETALQRQTHQEQAFNRVIQTIRNSLELKTIFTTSVQEFTDLLQMDGAAIIQYLPERQCWKPVAEHLQSSQSLSTLELEISDLDNPIAQRLKQGEILVIEDTGNLKDAVNSKVAQAVSKIVCGWLILPLEVNGVVWGSLAGHRSPVPLLLTEDEIDLARRVGDQLAIAIQQANLYQQVQRLNQELEIRVQERTAALQESEEKFRQLAENINHVFYIKDINGQILYISPSYADIWGQPVDTLYCNSSAWLDTVHPEDRDRIIREIPILRKHCQGEIEYRIIRPNSEVRWISDRSFGIRNSQGEIYRIAGLAEDITNRKAAKAALQISEQNLRTIFNNVSSHLLVHDMDGTLLDVNDRVLEFQQIKREELLKLSILEDCSAPDADFHLASEYWQRAVAGETVHFEWKSRKPIDGTLFDSEITLSPIIWNGQSVILANARDVSERKQAQLRLQRQAEADQLLANIAQTINQSIELGEVLETCLEQIRQFLQCDRTLVCRFDSDYNIFIELEAISQAELSVSGQAIADPCFKRDWAERYRQGYITVCHDTQSPDILPCYAEFLTQIQVQANLAVAILQADQIWGMLIVHDCHAPHQWQPYEINLLKQLGVQIGIATQKASLYKQLENQLAQKEVLFKEIHHRVKNNLQVISSMLWLQTEATNHPAVSKALEDTRHRLRAMSLIHETLYQHDDVGRSNFHNYIQRLASSILAFCSIRPEQINLRFRLQPVVFNLETAMPCGLLLNELITNAIKHGFPDGRTGEICIALEQVLPCPSSTFQDVPPPKKKPSQAHSQYILTIQDNGVGMPESLNIKKLKSLGLKIAYDLALQLEGKLELDTSNGTIFRLTFSALEYGNRF
ncbi:MULTISPECIES: PAS domain S-box protein [Nostoc]|uniref:histidine kinase n=1 Tax=Nostoc paludosum FACHB-159 TaxID=2692908 RepID=A0ABR8KL08_9NOSO|nr:MULTISPECIES: PAS domain S-box protein [Nostoc]MBD2683402.1 PAS domain S-box protein [Nostoc sp. FACHB-857]MBD2739720.1 PAS domain S-box protein [Nostoc paludosum FACHB-159]